VPARATVLGVVLEIKNLIHLCVAVVVDAVAQLVGAGIGTRIDGTTVIATRRADVTIPVRIGQASSVLAVGQPIAVVVHPVVAQLGRAGVNQGIGVVTIQVGRVAVAVLIQHPRLQRGDGGDEGVKLGPADVALTFPFGAGRTLRSDGTDGSQWAGRAWLAGWPLWTGRALGTGDVPKEAGFSRVTRVAVIDKAQLAVALLDTGIDDG
jgi:hypothetical protein